MQKTKLKYRTYLCDYRYQDQFWSIKIEALSYEDAKNRMKALSSGRVIGQLISEIPIGPKSLIKRVMSWFLKLLS